MKIWACTVAAVAALVLTVGCGSDDETATPTPDVTSGSDATDGAEGTDGTDESDTTDSTDSTDSTDATDGTDGTDGSDSTDGTDGTDGPSGDGLIGSPCDTAADCQGGEAATCFIGFCTRFCRDQDGGNIPQACNAVSNTSVFPGAAWGCPLDYRVCVPEGEPETPVACPHGGTCGAGKECAGLTLISQNIVGGVCVPKGDRAGAGQPCTVDVDCQSLLCSNAGTCLDHCRTNQHCPPGNLCTGSGFQVSEEDTVPTAWGAFCSPAGGSLTKCKSQAACPDTDVCEVFIEPFLQDPIYWCVAAIEGGAEADEACTMGSDCATGRCLFAGIEDTTAEPYCTQVCQGSGDCPNDLFCTQVALHANGTADNPDDDPLFGLCVRGATDDYCFVSDNTCQPPGLCVQAEGEPEGIGTCVAQPDCQTAADCDDGLSCTEDTCTPDNTCSNTVFDGVCLIDGVCYDDGDPNPQTGCQSCAPGASNTAWTNADLGAACDDGDACTENDVCDGNGSCVGAALDCDDGLACTAALCVDGACQNPVTTGCAIDGVCYAADDTSADGCGICDPATPTAWSATNEGGACDDDDGCTENDQCAGGACLGTALDCDDGLDCTADSCTDGGCVNTDTCTDGLVCTLGGCAP